MQTFVMKILETAINGVIVLSIAFAIAGLAGWMDLKKESNWPRLFVHEDAAYWVARDQNQPDPWVILGTQQK